MDDNILYDAARRHIQAGRSVIPLKVTYDKNNKKSVKPGILWKKFQNELPTEIDVQTWFEKKQCTQLGMVLGQISGNIWVMDADGPAAVKWMSENAPPTSVYAHTRRGVHAYYRMPDGVAVKCDVDVVPHLKDTTGDQIDVKGVGGIATIPPSPHKDGQYEWQCEDWDNLTTWAPPVKDKYQRPTGNIYADDMIENKPFDGNTTVEGERNSRLASLAGQLFASGHYSYEYVLEWARDWNADNCSPPMDLDEITRTVKSIHEIHNRNNSVSAFSEDMEVLEFDDDDDEAAEYLAPSERILSPGGVLGRMMQFIEDRAYQPSPPIFALAASLVTIGTLVGQKVMTETGLRTNLYVVALADSGVGKNLPMLALEQLMMEAEVDNFLGPKRFASDAALISAVTHYDCPAQKSLMLFIDEVGDLFGVLKGQRIAAKVETITLMKELYSCTGSVYTKAFADTERNMSVFGPHLSFYGTGVPLRFWEMITYHDVIDGFIARCLILNDESPIQKGGIPKTLTVPYELKRDMKALAALPIKLIGNLAAIPAPVMVPKDLEAMALFNDWQDTIVVQQNKFRKDKRGRGAIYNRLAEHASKIALIHAVSLACAIPDSVGAESVQYAIDFMDWYLTPSEANLNNISEGKNDDIQRTIMDMMDGGKAVHQGHIINTLRRKFSRKVISDSLEMLQESRKIELIEKTNGPGGGRPAYLWRKILKAAKENETKGGNSDETQPS